VHTVPVQEEKPATTQESKGVVCFVIYFWSTFFMIAHAGVPGTGTVVVVVVVVVVS
jgi:hypothetical protein